MQLTLAEHVFDVVTAGTDAGALVLMLHGFPQTNYTWRAQLQPLGDAGFYAVAPNQRGYSSGARPAAVADYVTQNLLNDVLGMIDALGYESAHIVGHDWGGQLSWLLAALYPQRVKSLSVLSRPHPAAFAAAFKKDKQQAERSKHHKAFQDPAMARLLLADNAARIRNLFADAPADKDTRTGLSTADQDAYLEVLGDEAALNAAINWYRAPVEAGAEQVLAPAAVANIEVPTLYIWGDADSTVGRIAAEATGDYVHVPYRFEVLPGIGHFVTDQAPQQVTRLLLEHIGKYDG
jgi:pimeloyl-ACP methyl ester carboxylesterase